MRLLLAEDDPTVRFTLNEALSEAGFTVVECSNGTEALRALDTDTFDLLLTDIRMPGADGIAVFRRARETQPGIGVVLMTAYADTNDAVAVMREGARDYVLKPFEMEELLLRLSRVRDEVASRRGMQSPSAARPAPEPVLGDSPAMQLLRQRVEMAAASDAAVLIRGELGTGKGLCAREIHRRSRRAEHPFVTIDCAGSAAVEHDLFGRDATAGARRRQPGQLERASGGTVFLDDVSELSPTSQARLMSALDMSGFSVPSGQLIPLDVRLVASTSRDLEQAVASGSFRRDLYYRLNVIEVDVPPLRSRREDLPRLVQHFLGQLAERERRASVPVLDAAASATFATWPFPGNIRELLHVLEHAVVVARGNVIGVEHLPREMVRAGGPPGTAETPEPEREPDIQPLGAAVEQFEREYIQRALEKSGGHRTRAAALLGISRKTLWERLRDAARGDGGEE